MIRISATSTDVRKQKIMDILSQINYNACKTVQDFGLQVDNKFAEIPARILEAPSLNYANGSIKPRDGVWRPDNKHFLDPKTNVNFGFLNMDRRTQRSNVDNLGRMVNTTLKMLFINYVY